MLFLHTMWKSSVKLIILSMIIKVFGFDSEDLIENYEKLINSTVEKARVYQFDTDASRYKPDTNNTEDYNTFDFIIIGGGTTGSVIANRLSEIKDQTVLVLEAGKYGSIVTDIPGMTYVAACTDYNWAFYSVAQKYGCQGFVNQSCPCPRGRGVGGTGLINGLVYSRANPIDFDRLAAISSPDWSYKHILGYFLKSENFTQTNPAATINQKFHGKKGYLNVENYNIDNSRTTAFLQGNLELGYKLTDYNSPQEVGASLLQVTKRDGKRADPGTAFISPILRRRNLEVSTESYVVKIEINPITKSADAVLFTKNGRLFRAKARKEVILSAGTISSPQILLLSGVGRPLQLSKFGIPVIKDLPVGENLRDHVVISISLRHNSTDPSIDIRTALENFINNKGVLTSSGPSDGNCFYKTRLERIRNYPDIKLLTLPNIPNPIPNLNIRVLRYSNETLQDLIASSTSPSFSFLANALNTKSIGSVTLRSRSPYDYPLIDPNVLSKTKDLDRLYSLVQLIRNLTKTEAFRKINATITVPQLRQCQSYEFDSEEQWHCIFKQLAIPAYHPVGTCPMGRNPNLGAVVNPRLKVFGVGKLRVADASIYPFPIRAHPEANCILVGEKVSDMIKIDNLLF